MGYGKASPKRGLLRRTLEVVDGCGYAGSGGYLESLIPGRALAAMWTQISCDDSSMDLLWCPLMPAYPQTNPQVGELQNHSGCDHREKGDLPQSPSHVQLRN